MDGYTYVQYVLYTVCMYVYVIGTSLYSQLQEMWNEIITKINSLHVFVYTLYVACAFVSILVPLQLL